MSSGSPPASRPGDLASAVATETITAVIGDLEHARGAIAGWTRSPQAVAATLGQLAGELADLARALRQQAG